VISKVKDFFSKCFVVILGLATVVGSVLFLKNSKKDSASKEKREYEKKIRELEESRDKALEKNKADLEEKKKKLYSEKTKEMKKLKRKYKSKLSKEVVENRKSRKGFASRVAKKYGANKK